MSVRHAEPARDAPACAAIYAPYVTESVISLELRAPTVDEFAERIERYAATHPFLVADTAGRVEGFAYGAPHRERAGYRWACDVSVYVAEGAQRRGLGRALYRELLALLAEQGLTMACAGITLPNEASVGLHEALGFEPVGVYRRIAWKAGSWWDVGWWQRALAAPVDPPPEPGPPARP